MNEGLEFSEALKMNQEFRKQIRRKDIDRRLAQRRRQFLEEEQKQSGKEMQDKAGQSQSLSNAIDISNGFQRIWTMYLNNGNRLSKADLKELGKISCQLAGSKLILGSEKEFFEYLIHEFILNENYSETQELGWALLVFNNCLVVASPNYSNEPTILMVNSNRIMNGLINSQEFLQRIFSLALHGSKHSIKQLGISILFDIVYNSDMAFVQALVVNPKYLIINLLSNQMHTEPNDNIVRETLKVFFLIVKRLEFGSYQQFGKMRKFILATIRNSNRPELTYLGIMSLHALLKSLPSQRSTLSKAGMLGTILTQALALNNNALATTCLRMGSIMLDNKNEQQVKLILSFMEQGLQKFHNPEFIIFCFKVLYEVVVNSLYQVDLLPTNYGKLYNKMMELFQSNLNDQNILTQVSLCVAVITSKSRSMEKGQRIAIKTRMRNIIDSCLLEQKSLTFLGQAFQMLDSSSQMSQF